MDLSIIDTIAVAIVAIIVILPFTALIIWFLIVVYQFLREFIRQYRERRETPGER